MANKDWDLDAIDFYDDECNCKQYKEEEYKRDLKRYLDENDWFDKIGQEYFCNNSANCENCALYHGYGKDGNRFHPCYRLVYSSFETIKKIFVWAQEHPIITNRDVLKKTFGDDVFSHVLLSEWLDKEYKEPTKEEND